MDDIASKITEMLQNPDSVEQIKAMADSLFNKSGEETPPKQEAPSSFSDIDIGSMMKVASLLKNSACDNRSNLLLALKPHLSDERKPRVDKAIKILKLVSLIPVFREQGILNF